MYAIDFGTSNTVVARWNADTGSPETIVLPGLSIQQKGNPPLVPSLLYVEKAATAIETVETVAGKAVRDRGLDLSSDPRFFSNFKRGIGTPVQGFIPELDGHILSFEAVGNWFLRNVIESIRQQDPALDSLIFTVPVDSFEPYRNWLGSVCQSLDINQVRLIDEPTAAALGYQITPAEKTLLVVDFGGGTLDLSLIQPTFAKEKPTGFFLKWGNQSRGQSSDRASSSPSPKTVRVLAKAGENLGGADVDRWLVEHFAQTQALPITPLTLRLVEKLKIVLSFEQTAEEAYFDEETLESYELMLTRDRLEDILTNQGFFERLDSRLDQVLQQAQRQSLALGCSLAAAPRFRRFKPGPLGTLDQKRLKAIARLKPLPKARCGCKTLNYRTFCITAMAFATGIAATIPIAGIQSSSGGSPTLPLSRLSFS